MKVIKIIIVTMTIILIPVIAGLTWMNIFKSGAKKAQLYTENFNPQMELLNDGAYSGNYEYCYGLIQAKIYFEVKEHKISAFHFERLTGTPKYGAQHFIEKLIDSTKSIQLDAITGATYTSSLAKAAIKSAIKTNNELRNLN